ncbi:hypothetical protein [Tenacibaculum ovolyticum]|uniref:hypothetical protein n=1 Tax=Tenacibaculum ovolyticum TaxID=104270 RepID=UPI001F1A2BAF|nr:hypothetical protein [Tenacibaculum ovolyticum]
MNTITNSEKLIIQPPGEKIRTIGKENIIESGNIYFENNFNKPIPTLVEATYHEITENNLNPRIHIKGLFFVESEVPLESALVNQLFSISNFGQPKLQFFIYSSIDEAKSLKKSSGKYKAYTIDFYTDNITNFPKGINLKDIKIAQTFSWNIDPETSRGTETIVKTSNT